MKQRYLGLEQFRAEETNRKKEDDELLLQTDDEDNRVVLLSAVPTVRALGGDDSRLIEFIITDESVDRMADTIATKGWDIKAWKKNPVVLWAHSHYDPPVGRGESIEVDKTLKQIRSICEFTPRDLNPLGYMVYQMYKQKFLNATSVGFKPKEYSWVTEAEDAERAKRGGINFLKQELLEYSAVPVPANPNALAIARSAGIDTLPMKMWAEQVLDEASSRNLDVDARQHMEVLRAASSPTGRALILEIGDMKKAATPEPSEEVEEVKKTSSVVEIVTRRWMCKDDCDHQHDTKEDAEAYASINETIDKFAASTATMTDVLGKSGRVLSKKNENALRTAAESILSVLAQVADEDEEEDDDEKSTGVLETIEAAAPEDDDLIHVDQAAIDAAVKAAITTAFNEITGRVD